MITVGQLLLRIAVINVQCFLPRLAVPRAQYKRADAGLAQVRWPATPAPGSRVGTGNARRTYRMSDHLLRLALCNRVNRAASRGKVQTAEIKVAPAWIQHFEHTYAHVCAA